MKIKKLLSVILVIATVMTLVSFNTVSTASYTAYGVDVSAHQGTINWKKAAEAGIDFAIIRAGFTSGKDKCFEANYAGAKANGINVGVYFYSYAKTTATALNDANDLLSWLAGKQFEYPIFIDMEDPSQVSLSTDERMAIVNTFLQKLESAGYFAGIYANTSWYNNYLDKTALKRYVIWEAAWTSSGEASKDKSSSCQLWQYTSKADGASYGMSSTYLDLDVSYVDYPSIIVKKGFNGFHVYSAAETVAPTCTEKGYTVYKCTKCESTYTEYTDALGHDIRTLFTEPTCTEEGFAEEVCSRCDYSNIKTVIPPLGHICEEYEVTKEPSCTEEGEKTYICSYCKEQITESIAKTEHDLRTLVNAPTCTEEGFTETVCSNCDYSVITNKTAPLGHNFAVLTEVVEPTYTEGGYSVYKCTRCDETVKCDFTKPLVPQEFETPKLTVTTKSARAGEAVIVNVEISNNPGINTFALKVNYDESAMKLDGVKVNVEDMTGQFVFADKIVWLTAKDTDFNGTAITLVFIINENADLGDYAVSVSYEPGDISNYNEEDVNFATESGYVRVIDYIPGDINRDLVVDNNDLTALMRYLSDENVDLVTSGFDVNGDGVINTKDLTRLMKYLSGDSVEIF